MESQQAPDNSRYGPFGDLNRDEVVAVALGLRAVQEMVTLPRHFREASGELLLRLERNVPSDLVFGSGFSHSVGCITDENCGDALDYYSIRQISKAIRKSKALRFAYVSSSGLLSRTVVPKRLASYHGSWYLLAWDLVRNDWRTFRVERMVLPASVKGKQPSWVRCQPMRLPGYLRPLERKCGGVKLRVTGDLSEVLEMFCGMRVLVSAKGDDEWTCRVSPASYYDLAMLLGHWQKNVTICGSKGFRRYLGGIGGYLQMLTDPISPEGNEV